MGKKKVKTMLSAAAVMIAVGSGIGCAWKAGRKKKMAEDRTDVSDLEEGLTEEKVRESLLRLFRLYEDSEFDDLVEFLDGLENKSSIPAMTAIIFAEASCPGDTRHSHAILSQKYPAST